MSQPLPSTKAAQVGIDPVVVLVLAGLALLGAPVVVVLGVVFLAGWRLLAARFELNWRSFALGGLGSAWRVPGCCLRWPISTPGAPTWRPRRGSSTRSRVSCWARAGHLTCQRISAGFCRWGWRGSPAASSRKPIHCTYRSATAR